MQKGRQVPALEEFTFKDTGITVQLRKVSPLLRDDLDAMLRRTNPPPSPPLNTVPAGFGDAPQKQEPNEADPDYAQALLKWQLEHFNRVGEALFALAVKRYVEVEVDHEAVAQLRADCAAIGIDLDPDDKLVYVSRICIGTNEDRVDLSNALFKRSSTFREAVDSHKATFRGDVPGTEHLADSDAPDGAPLQ